MASVTGGGGYEFIWRGDDMLDSIRNNTVIGMQELKNIALDTMNELVAVDTGYLKSTIFARITLSGGVWVLEFGATAYYTIYVELGTSIMAAQPFIRPAADAIQQHARQALSRPGAVE